MLTGNRETDRELAQEALEKANGVKAEGARLMGIPEIRRNIRQLPQNPTWRLTLPFARPALS